VDCSCIELENPFILKPLYGTGEGQKWQFSPETLHAGRDVKAFTKRKEGETT